MTYVRKYYTHSLKGPQTSPETIYEVYDQPLVDRVRYRVFEALWTSALRPRFLHKFVDGPLERVLQWVHSRKCNDDCSEATNVGTGVKFRACGRFPLCATLDCILYTLDHKNNKILHNTRP